MNDGDPDKAPHPLFISPLNDWLGMDVVMPKPETLEQTKARLDSAEIKRLKEALEWSEHCRLKAEENLSLLKSRVLSHHEEQQRLLIDCGMPDPNQEEGDDE